jgi:hypothetical protein
LKEAIKTALREMFFRHLSEFCHETEQDYAQIEAYTNSFIKEFERYLIVCRDFEEFKED